MLETSGLLQACNGTALPLPSSDVVGVIKLRRIGWAGRVARVGDKRDTNIVSEREPEEKIPLCRTSADGRVVLELILRE